MEKFSKNQFSSSYPGYKLIIQNWPEGEYSFNEELCAIQVKFTLVHELRLSDREGSISLLDNKTKRLLGDCTLDDIVKSFREALKTLKESKK